MNKKVTISQQKIDIITLKLRELCKCCRQICLKGAWNEIFDFRFFSEIGFARASSNFYENRGDIWNLRFITGINDTGVKRKICLDRNLSYCVAVSLLFTYIYFYLHNVHFEVYATWFCCKCFIAGVADTGIKTINMKRCSVFQQGEAQISRAPPGSVGCTIA